MRRRAPLPTKRPNPASASVLDALIRQWDAVMAARPAVRNQHERTFNMRSLWRLAIWGSSAAVALAIAVGAGYSDTGSRRLIAAATASGGAGTAQKAAPPAQAAMRPAENEPETRRLAEAVRVLAADRERLVARIGTLERNLEDITGSIKRQAATAADGAAPPPAPAASSPAAVAAAPAPAREAAVTPPAEASGPARRPAATAPAEPTPAGADRAAALDAPGDPSAAESVARRTELGVDVGGAVNFDGLRVLWSSTKGSNAGLFEGLHPVVAVRENSRTKAVELRLIAGPLANAEAAARVCATLSAARRYCQPVAFEGQRLAQADVVPERKPAAPRAAPQPAPRSGLPFR
jgi:hypothetical protein